MRVQVHLNTYKRDHTGIKVVVENNIFISNSVGKPWPATLTERLCSATLPRTGDNLILMLYVYIPHACRKVCLLLQLPSTTVSHLSSAAFYFNSCHITTYHQSDLEQALEYLAQLVVVLPGRAWQHVHYRCQLAVSGWLPGALGL